MSRSLGHKRQNLELSLDEPFYNISAKYIGTEKKKSRLQLKMVVDTKINIYLIVP